MEQKDLYFAIQNILLQQIRFTKESDNSSDGEKKKKQSHFSVTDPHNTKRGPLNRPPTYNLPTFLTLLSPPP